MEPNSVLFFRKGDHASYLYQGAIVEPQVYEFIENRFSGRTMPPHLLQFRPQPVSVSRMNATGDFVVRGMEQ